MPNPASASVHATRRFSPWFGPVVALSLALSLPWPGHAAKAAAPSHRPATPELAQPTRPQTMGAAAAKEVDPATDAAWTIGDRRPHSRAQTLSLSVGIWPPTTLSGALWYATPVAADGFIPAVNDSVDIEFGLAVAGYFDGPDHGALIPAVGGRWNFHVTHDWTPFVTLKLAARFGLGPYNPDWFDLGLSLGSLLRLHDTVSLRLEVGYPTGLAVGLSFPFGG